jgi:mannosyltransferase OCH1-like enzyme
MPTFDKNIIQIWIQGYENIKKEVYLQNKKNWKDFNPDWTYRCLNHDDLKKICYLYSQECGQTYDKIDLVHTRVDLARVVFIYLYGGIYVDMDMYAFRPLNNNKQLMDIIARYNNGESKNILGLSLNKTNYIESMLFTGYKQTLGNVITISNKGNVLLKNYIDFMVTNITNVNMSLSPEFLINETTGPIIFNKFFNQNLINNNKFGIDYTLFNPEIFEPCDVSGECSINNDTLAIHNFELTWISDKYKWILKFYYTYKFPIYFILIYITIYFIKSRL